MPSQPALPSDQRQHQGGLLFLLSLAIFFFASIALYAIYAYIRWDDKQTEVALPGSFLISTVCLLLISGLVHVATRAIRNEKRETTMRLLSASALAAIVFMAVQFHGVEPYVDWPCNGTRDV